MFSMNTPHEEACLENTDLPLLLMEVSKRGYTSADRDCLCYPPMETPQRGCTSVSNHRTFFVPFTDANIPKGIQLSYSNFQLIKEEKGGNKVEKRGESDRAAATTRVVIRRGSLKMLETPQVRVPYTSAARWVREREKIKVWAGGSSASRSTP